MSAIAASACPRAMPQVETKIANGAPMKITPSVSQKPSTSKAHTITPNSVKITMKNPAIFSTAAHVRSVPYRVIPTSWNGISPAVWRDPAILAGDPAR
jgi:hypothetical protein